MICLVWGQMGFGQSPYVLTGNENWGTMSGGTSPPTQAANGVEVGGYELKIEGITLVLNSGKTITVDVGGLLQISDATIESSSPNTWVGIEATGSSGLEQYSTYPTQDLNNELTWQGDLNSAQTQIILNNSFINNAKIGVKSTGGAIIQTRNGGFYNCEKCVFIDSYINPNPDTKKKKINACYFMGTNFTWHDILSGFNSSDFIGIKLKNVRGINIGGCKFVNNDPTHYCTLTRGTGIYSEESNFAISKDGDELCSDGRIGCDGNCFSSAGDGDSTKFDSLTYGIVTLGNTSNKEDRIGIRNSAFKNNLYSVDISYSLHSVIFESTFEANRSLLNNLYIDYINNNQCEYSSNLNGTFIATNNSGAIRIVQNELKYNSTDWTFLYIQETGNNGKSLIRKNKIKDSNSGVGGLNQVYGIISKDNNSNLDIECNEFDNLSNDIYCDIGSSLKNIKRSALCNENTWSYATSTNGRYNCNNDGDNIEIVVHNGVYFRIGGFNYAGTNLIPNNNGINCDPLDDCDVLNEETGLGTKNIKNNKGRIYPNPAQNVLNIEMKTNVFKEDYIFIYDLQGREVLKEKLNEVLQIDISKLPFGLLFIKVANGNEIYTQKIIIHQE